MPQQSSTGGVAACNENAAKCKEYWPESYDFWLRRKSEQDRRALWQRAEASGIAPSEQLAAEKAIELGHLTLLVAPLLKPGPMPTAGGAAEPVPPSPPPAEAPPPVAQAAPKMTPPPDIVRPGHVRIYRGTGHPHLPQVSRRLRPELEANPNTTLPSNENALLDQEAATQHSGANLHPDAVSATTDKQTAKLAAPGTSKSVVVYDIPRALHERLPVGDPAQGEVVFKDVIPEKYRVGVYRFHGGQQ